MYTRNIVLPTKKSFFLFGPRGVGKSTLVRATYPKATIIDLLDSRTYQRLLADPGALIELIPKNANEYTIIDEVQRVPELLNEVHRLIENNKHKFVLTGSSARKLRRGGVNLLAGRALTYRLYPLSAEEVGSSFDLTQAIKYGMLPEVINSTTEEEKNRYLLSYIETYLKEEIMAEGLTRNLAGFARFLQVASFSVGSVLNISEIAREVMIERKVVENYFSILDDLMLGIRIPVFTKRAKRELVAKPKFYFFDTGVYQTLRPQSVLDSESEVGGAALESLFLQIYLATVANEVDKFEISYFRTVAGSEVDFVIHGKDKLIAIEIKNSHRYNSSWLRGLRQFGKDYPEAKLQLLYTGRERMYVGDIEVIPVAEYLMQMSKMLLV